MDDVIKREKEEQLSLKKESGDTGYDSEETE